VKDERGQACILRFIMFLLWFCICLFISLEYVECLLVPVSFFSQERTVLHVVNLNSVQQWKWILKANLKSEGQH